MWSSQSIHRNILLALALCASILDAQDSSPALGPPQVVSSPRLFLRSEWRPYRNFSFQNFTQYPNHTLPFDVSPRAYYNSMGDYLITGYPLYEWLETRAPEQQWGSSIFKDVGFQYNTSSPWVTVFDNVVLARDGYGGWGYTAMVGDALIARFTPLTLSKTNFNGMRVDISTPYLKFTALGSRIERPHSYLHTIPAGGWFFDDKFYLADNSTLLAGSRMQIDLGVLNLGLNWVNHHLYQSAHSGNSLKGRLRPDQPLIDWIVVRFSDDSPEDGMGGAVVQDVRLIVNGEVRDDLKPQAVRNHRGITPQVGRFSRATGEFRTANYVKPTSDPAFEGNTYYRDREIPLFADYLYRLDHEAAIDVSGDTNLDGLLSSFSVESPLNVLRADGQEQLAFLFDLSAEPQVESVEMEALLGNDYRVEVAFLYPFDPRANTYHAQYISSYYSTVLQASGNVQDLSNQRRVRVKFGENTGQFVYSADLSLRLAGLEVHGEYARSSLYSRYPAQAAGVPQLDEGPRFSNRGEAYFLNATRWFGKARVGGEYFSINPEFSTEMRNYLAWDDYMWLTHFAGLTNRTIYWQLVDDNEDGDRYPDRRVGNLPGLLNDTKAYDIDGVFLGQDENNDGTPEVNRNLNLLPDYEEPFLMYDVEPNDYVYGLDRNNNDEPDQREDDGDVDYPYDYDQRGFHLFGQWSLTRRWLLAAGRYDVDQIARAGSNNSTYVLLTYDRTGVARLRRLFFENHLRRVRDDIPDEFVTINERPIRDGNFGHRGLTFHYLRAWETRPPRFRSSFRRDPIRYRDSYVNETYFESRLRPRRGLHLVQKVRLRVNWQQGGQLQPGIFQRKRRLDFWTVVSQVGYTRHWGRLSATAQYKFMFLRLQDQERNRALHFETRSIPILRASYPLMNRTTIQAGVQGMGPLSYRLKDRVAGRESFEQHTSFLTLTNRSKYFGYEIVTIAGVYKDRRKFDKAFQAFQSFDSLSYFVRGVVGFSEFGRMI